MASTKPRSVFSGASGHTSQYTHVTIYKQETFPSQSKHDQSVSGPSPRSTHCQEATTNSFVCADTIECLLWRCSSLGTWAVFQHYSLECKIILWNMKLRLTLVSWSGPCSAASMACLDGAVHRCCFVGGVGFSLAEMHQDLSRRIAGGLL